MSILKSGGNPNARALFTAIKDLQGGEWGGVGVEAGGLSERVGLSFSADLNDPDSEFRLAI